MSIGIALFSLLAAPLRGAELAQGDAPAEQQSQASSKLPEGGAGLMKAEPSESIAILGDSFSTGALAHPRLRFDQGELLQLLEETGSLQADTTYGPSLEAWGLNSADDKGPVRLGLTRREFTSPLSWVFHQAFQTITQQYFDSEEYSWGYLLGRKTALKGQQILVAARDGDRSEDALNQVDRVLEATNSRAVRHLVIFFSGMDICAPDPRLATSAEDYAENIERALRYYAQNIKNEKKLSHVWLLDPIGLLQLVSSPAILRHKVNAFGAEVSCSDLQAGRAGMKPPSTTAQTPETALFTQFFSQGPRTYCPALFGLHEQTSSSEMLIQLGTLLTSYRQQLQKLGEKVKRLHPNLQVRHLKSTGEVLFGPEDIAQDCMHPNLSGHMKIAKGVLSEIGGQWP